MVPSFEKSTSAELQPKTGSKPEKKRDRKEKKLESYHFKEIFELKEPMGELVQKLKDKIEAGEYDALISDEVGGRIPTLILRKIFKDKNPEKKLATYFIAAGTWGGNEQAIASFVEKVKNKVEKALVVTELISTGRSMRRLAQIFENSGIINFDVASAALYEKSSLVVGGGKDEYYLDSDKRHGVFFGLCGPLLHALYENSSKLAGVEKDLDLYTKIIGAHPRKLGNLTGVGRSKNPQSPEEFEEMKRNVKNAREDVKTMADYIVKKVWPEKEETK